MLHAYSSLLLLFARRLGGALLAVVGFVIGLAGIVRVIFYRDPISG